MKQLSILTLIICLYSHAFAQNNGYSLEFEDVVTLSVDSLSFPSPGTITKSFTVPAGTVLKISSGHLSLLANKAYVSSTQGRNIVTGFLKINGNTIIGADTSMMVYNASGSYITSIYRIKPDQPIWAPSNATVTIGVVITDDTFLTAITQATLFSNWISGVLFRKVQN